MLKNFFTTAVRNIAKHKAFSIINFVGLTCGMALSLLIISYLRSELSYDKFHERADRLYRLNYLVPNGLKLATTPPPIAPLLKEYFPGVEEAARVYRRNVSIAHLEGAQADSFEETDVLFADSAIMKMFTFSFVSGDPDRGLKERFTLLINEEMAKKYFGDKDPVGESLILGGKHTFKIAGVVRNLPENSHIRFNMLVPYDNMYDLESDQGAAIMRQNLAVNFIISHGYTFVLMKPGADAHEIDKGMPDFLKKYALPRLLVGQTFVTIPMTDIHLKSTTQDDPSANNSMTTLYIFGAVGILTLLIACINYINLSTAQSFTRIKEIGIRKILGSAKSQLIGQFISESFLFCLVSFVISFGVFYLTLPLLNRLTDKNLLFSETVDAPLLLTSVVLLGLITLLAGGYPAWFVAQFNSVSSLKGSGGNVNGSPLLRKTLVVFQLMIACLLLSGSLMLIKQLNFLNTRELGFAKDQVITIPLFSQNLNSIFGGSDSTFRSRLQSFRDEVETETGVEQTTVSSSSPGLGTIYRGAIPEGFTNADNLFIADLSVDYNFLKTFGIKLVAGREFSKEFGTDPAEGFIVNETAIREFHWDTPEKALGKTMNREGKKGKIIGVVQDFNMESLTTPIGALILEVNPQQWTNLSIKMKTRDVKAITERLRLTWNRMFPEKTFEYTFLDEQLQQQYSNYENFGLIIQSFTFVAVLISCLGVYGLVLFVVKRKVKEIGVRKVLGANVSGILKLIYQDFAWLLLVGFLLAVPISYYFINQWLDNFTFRTNIDVLTYAISFGLILLVVTLTISYQAIKASFANPVDSLRTE